MSRYIDIEPYERKPGGDIKEHTCRIEVKTVFANGFGTVHEQRVKTEDIPTAAVMGVAEFVRERKRFSELFCAERIKNGNLQISLEMERAENYNLREKLEWFEREGEWQQDENGDFVCSECMGALSDIFNVMHAYVRDVDIERVEICPFCGARMINGEACEDAEKAKSKKVRTDITETP